MAFSIYLDIKRCSGCHACVVACMDQNDTDVEKGEPAWRKVFIVEDGDFPEIKVSYVPLACMHCQDTPCLIACPTGAIYKKEPGIVYSNPALCIGCHSCLIVCPFGIPRFGKDGKMQKCTMCSERVEEGLAPACVRVCPTKALKFGPINELGDHVEAKVAEKLVRAFGSQIVKIH